MPRCRKSAEMYVEKSAQLGAEASIAALVLSNAECDDVEFLMLKPKRVGSVQSWQT